MAPPVKNRGTEGRATEGRATGRRGTPRVPKARVQILAKNMILDFDTWVFSHEIVELLFRNGELPPGFRLESKGGGNPAFRWTLSWHFSPQGLNPATLSGYGEQLYYRALGGGDEFAEDTAAREQAVEEERSRRRQHNKTFVPALGMTGGEAMQTLKPGLYVAAPGKGIATVPPLTPGKEWPPPTDWIKPYAVADGWFAWMSPGGNLLEMYVLGRYPRFWREIVYFVLHEHDSLPKAVDKYCKRWDELNRMMISAFALALTTAPSVSPRAKLTEGAFGSSISKGERGIGGEAKQPFGSIVKSIDPIEAAQVAVMVAAKPWEGLKGLVEADDDKLQVEMDTLSDAILVDLRKRMADQPEKQFNRALRTGEMGEAIVKKTLQLRGYEVVDLQNASGQGIDLVGIKIKGGVASIIVFEIKSSEVDNPGSYTEAQRNPRAFYTSRLQAVINRQGKYTNVPQATVEIAKRIDAAVTAGHPIGTVRVGVHWAKLLSFKVKFRIWRPMPKAVVNPHHK